jgi:AraC-like DNA-binding protein
MKEAVAFVSLTAPACSALLCLALLLCCRLTGTENETDGKRLRIMAVYLLAVMVNTANQALYVVCPPAYVCVNALHYLSLLLTPVMFYHLVFTLTRTGRNERFPLLHCIIPAGIAAVFIILSFPVPFDVQLLISRGSVPPGYGVYPYFFTARLPLAGLYGILYMLLGLHRLRRYKCAVAGYSADCARSSLEWLYLLCALSPVAFFPVSPASFLAGKQIFPDSFLLPYLVSGAVALVFHAFLCYNMLKGNYVLIRPSIPAPKPDSLPRLNRFTFETCMRKRRLYLDPDLKIGDLQLHFHTGRQYLSNFIHSEFGMSFKRYINILRVEEFERLREDPAFAEASDMELVLAAGFSSYRGYRQFVRAESAVRQKEGYY